MRNRAALAEEELGFSCGIKLVLANIFVGILLGSMAWVPVSFIYAGLQFGFPGLPNGGMAIAITYGGCLVVGAIWGVLAAEKFRDISFRFNRQYLKVCRDGVVRYQILWEDVDRVKQGAPYVIRTRQGARVEIPSSVLLSERYDNRALKNQLATYAKPQVTPPPKKFAWIGFVSLIIGVPLLSVSKRPHEVFANADGLSSSTWLQIVPSILGCIGTVSGVFCLLFWISLLADKKKPHPYEIGEGGIREGKKLLTWTEIQHLNSFGAKDLQIQIRLLNGQQRVIDCEKFSNGVELRDAIFSTAPPVALLVEDVAKGLAVGHTLTANSWTTQGSVMGCLALFGVLGLLVAGMATTGKMTTSRPSDVAAVEVLGLLIFLLITTLIVYASYQIDLSENEIRFKRGIFPARSFGFKEIDAVEIRSNHTKNGPVDIMTIRAKSGAISFSSSLDKYGEIRDTILSRVPEAKVRYS